MKGNSGRSVRLGDVMTIKHGYAFKGEHFGAVGSHIVLTPGNFFEDGGFRKKGDKEKWYSGPIPEGYVLRRGDLIVAMTEQAEGLLGSSAIIPEDNLYLHNQRLGLIENLNGVDRRFLYYLFNSRPVRQQIRGSCSGVKVRHTSPSRIYEVRACLPPLRTQRKIAAILSAYDDLIENNQRRIQILEEMARLIYREWFVHFRFPGHEGVRFVDSPLGRIPEGWRIAQLGDVSAINAESLQSPNPAHVIRYVDISSVSPGQIDKIEEMALADAPGRARRVVRHGDTIWSTVRPNRRSFALILTPPDDMIVSTGFAVISPRSIPFSYLYCAVTTDTFVSYLVNHTKGAAYPAVSSDDFRCAEFTLPPDALLDRFHQTVWPVLLHRQTLLAMSPVLRRTRDLLLPRLISGELDVSDLHVSQEEDNHGW